MPESGLFHFRAHYGEYNPIDILDFVKAKAEVVLMVKEIDANRPHIHSVITEFKQTMSTFRQQLLKKFPLLADRNHSIKCKKDLEAQKRYLCKGENKNTMPEVIYSANIDIQSYHAAYWKVNDELVQGDEGNKGSQKDTSSLSKAKSKTWTEKVFDEIIVMFESECRKIKYKYEIGSSHMTEYEIKEEAKSRLLIFNYFMKRLGYRKMNRNIIRDMFDGIINGIIQTSVTAGENYSLQFFKDIYPDIANVGQFQYNYSPIETTNPVVVANNKQKDDNIILCIIEDD